MKLSAFCRRPHAVSWDYPFDVLFYGKFHRGQNTPRVVGVIISAEFNILLGQDYMEETRVVCADYSTVYNFHKFMNLQEFFLKNVNV
jgi:hypothetical protein